MRIQSLAHDTTHKLGCSHLDTHILRIIFGSTQSSSRYLSAHLRLPTLTAYSFANRSLVVVRQTVIITATAHNCLSSKFDVRKKEEIKRKLTLLFDLRAECVCTRARVCVCVEGETTISFTKPKIDETAGISAVPFVCLPSTAAPIVWRQP